jgi:hypothetical protein
MPALARNPSDRPSGRTFSGRAATKPASSLRELPVMNSPQPAVRPTSNRNPGRRIAAAVVLSTVLFTVLWIMMFSMVTSLLIGAGCCVVIVAASSASDIVEMLLDAVSTVIFGAVAVIAAIFGAIFSIFDF